MQLRKPERDEKAMMSAADDNGTGGLQPSRVGAELRAARLHLGWQLPEVSQGLRIRLPYLEAIEDGRVADLPGAAYAIGFVRTYAKSLGLDPEEIARRYRSETQEVNRKTELTFPAPVPERGVPAGAVVLLGLVLAVGAYAAWYKFSPTRPDAAGISPVPERMAQTADRVPSSNVSPQVASILPPPTPPVPSLIETRPLAFTSPSTSSAATSAQAAPIIVPPVPIPIPVPVSMTPLPMPSPQSQAAAQPDAGRVVLRFKADSFVQVREKQGSVLLNRVMKAGESWPVPKQQNLVMLTGNAGGTEIVVDGITAASLGADKAVKRDVSLEPDAIKLPPGTKLPPQPRTQ